MDLGLFYFRQISTAAAIFAVATSAAAQEVITLWERFRWIQTFERYISNPYELQKNYNGLTFAREYPIPAAYEDFIRENEEILNHNIALLRSDRKILKKSMLAVATEMCMLGPLNQPVAVLQGMATHLDRLARGRSNVPDIAFARRSADDCKDGRSRSFGETIVYSVPEAEALLQQALATRFPKIKVDPIVSYHAEIDGALVEVQELPFDIPIFVRLIFELDDPAPGTRLVDVTIGSETIQLEAFQVGPSEFQTQIPFEVVEPQAEVSP
ncbi:MAG: hypothetical protein AAGM84_00650 [Pseudomonadota bacterium]